MVQSSGKLRNFFKTKHAFNHITQQLHFWAFPRERKMYVRTKTCTQIFTEALFVIVKTWKQSRCPLMGECLDKLWCIQVVEYYSAIKRNEILIHTTTSMNLRHIKLSKRGWHKRPFIVWFHLNEMSRKGKSTKTENKLLVVWGWE